MPLSPSVGGEVNGVFVFLRNGSPCSKSTSVLAHATFALTADTYTHLYNDALHKGMTSFPNPEVG